MARTRAEPPSAIADRKVLAFVDLARGERRFADGRVEPTELPEGDVLALELEGGHRVMLRPSGTEPKIKFYFDVRVDIAPGEEIESARARGEALLNELVGGLAALT